MEDVNEFLQSRPLISFQMDGSHLNNVLQSVIGQQQQLSQSQRQLAQRLGEVEEGMKDIYGRQSDLERYIAEFGGTDKAGQVRARLEDLENAMDRVVKGLEDARKMASAAGQDADQAGRLADQANRALQPLQDAVAQTSQDVDVLARQSAQDKRDIGRALNELEQQYKDNEKKLAEAVEELQQRADRIARETGSQKLLQMIEELSDRTDDNFRSVEESARAVDAEISRQNADITRLRTDMGALEEKTRGRITSLVTDVDGKYEVLLSAFREYEKSSNELEEHLAMAGQALARRRR